MPRFFFDIGDGEQARDENGLELPDAAIARVSALRYTAELLQQHPALLENAPRWWLSIRDERGGIVSTIRIELGDGAPSLTEQRPDGGG